MVITGIAADCRRLERHVDDLWLDLPLAAGDVLPTLRRLLGEPPDWVSRRIAGGTRVVFLESIVDTKRLERTVFRGNAGRLTGAPWVYGAQVSTPRTYGDAVRALLRAHVLLIRRGDDITALAMECWPERSPEEPSSEIVPQGPHAGFVEVLDTNIGLLRQRIPARELRWERFTVGARAQTRVALVFMCGLIADGILDQLRRRLTECRPSFVVDASMLQEWLTNTSGALFPAMDSTERPDTTAAAILEGRCAILVDGSPVALIAPTVFADLLSVASDYYNRSFDATIKRLLRLAGLLASLVVTPLFVAIVTVNQELLPAPVYVSIAQSRLDTPLPLLVEVLVMEAVVELVREAGLRMPGALGQTISIVGAIVIGQSAVMAGLISAPVVVVVAMEYIANTVVPSLDTRLALRMLRFPLIVLAAVFGIFGLFWGLMILMVYLMSLESFGVPYLAPLFPRRTRGLQDTVYRRPLTDLRPATWLRPRPARSDGRRRG